MGLAKIVQREFVTHVTAIGTLAWAGPELLTCAPTLHGLQRCRASMQQDPSDSSSKLELLPQMVLSPGWLEEPPSANLLYPRNPISSC